MKIAFLIHTFYPDSSGGSETYCYHLARELATRGHQVIIITRYADGGDPEYHIRQTEYNGLAVYRINNTFRTPGFMALCRDPGIDRAILAVMHDFQPDCVHIHHLTCLSTGVIEQLPAPSVLTLHDYWYLCHRGQLFNDNDSRCTSIDPWRCSRCLLPYAAGGGYNILRRVKLWLALRRRNRFILRQLNRVNRIICPSRFIHDFYQRQGIATNTVVLPYGVKASALTENRFSSPLRFGFIGSLLPTKGLHLLLEAFAGIDPTRAKLNVFGPFVEYPYIDYAAYRQRLEQHFALPHVTYHGTFAPDQIDDVFRDCIDILVVPSVWYENSPLTIQEAYVRKRPVLAAALGGMAEAVRDGTDGYLFPPNDAAGLRAVVRRCIDNPERLAAMQRNLSAVTIGGHCRDMLRIYREVAG